MSMSARDIMSICGESGTTTYRPPGTNIRLRCRILQIDTCMLKCIFPRSSRLHNYTLN